MGYFDHDSVTAPQDRTKLHASQMLIWAAAGAVGGVSMAVILSAVSGTIGVAVFIAIAIGVASGFGRRKR